MARIPQCKWLLIVSICVVHSAAGWGKTGHSSVNKNAVVHLPVSMNQFIAQSTFFSQHASDADNRKSTDPTESPKHFIDIDYYPNFGTLTHSYDTLIAAYGQSVVMSKGILPWAVVTAFDTLTAQLRRWDWNSAYLTASDLGHYTADAYQPLHDTKNFDGQNTGNNGIHSRYESDLINLYQTKLQIQKDSVYYVSNPLDHIFADILRSNIYVDSIMKADTYARNSVGWNGSTVPPNAYYDTLWMRVQFFTRNQFQSATTDLASLWYTAWINAGLIALPTSVRPFAATIPEKIMLYQNYPNPFNPVTTISYHVPSRTMITLTVYSVLGEEIETLVQEEKAEGDYQIRFDAGALASGVYLCTLSAGGYIHTRTMAVVK